jgi:ribonuclease HI
MPDSKHVHIFTDGACSGNPGPGGWAAILQYGDRRREMSGGFRLTTNNRMELMGAIKALEALRQPCGVTITSDSEYVVNGIKKGWAAKWRAAGWKRPKGTYAPNWELWQRLLDLCEQHRVQFQWVEGHAGHPENERCDELAVAEASRKDLPADIGYERPPVPGVSVVT